MSPPGFDIQGHRGARGLYPENTIPAFVAALDLGADTLEMDVVVSRDRQVVVSHDPWLSRTICLRPDGRRIPRLRERRYRIYDLSYEAVAAYDCGSLRHPGFPRQQTVPASKPLLADVIAEAERHAEQTGRKRPFYSIETKSRPEWDGIYHPDPGTFSELVVEVLDRLGVLGRSIVQSFDPRTLRGVKRIDASVRLSLLANRRRSRDLDRNLDTLGFVPAIYSPHHACVDERLLEQAHRRDMRLVPWTVNEADRMVHLRALGVDGLITDYPDVAVRAIRS